MARDRVNVFTMFRDSMGLCYTMVGSPNLLSPDGERNKTWLNSPRRATISAKITILLTLSNISAIIDSSFNL